MNQQKSGKQMPKKPISQRANGRTPARVDAFGVSGPLETLARTIAYGLSAPGEQNSIPSRWAAPMSQKKTGLASPFEKLNADFGQVSASPNNELLQKDNLIILKRIGECSAIVYLQNSAGAPKEYLCNWQADDGRHEASGFFTVVGGDTKKVKISTAVPSADPTKTFKPHGDMLFAGSVSGTTARFVWVDKGDALVVNLQQATVGAPGAAIDLILDRYSSSGLQEGFKRTPCIVPDLAVPLIQIVKAVGEPSGYYALSLHNKEAVDVLFQINAIAIGGSSASFGHRALPDFMSNLSRVQGLRVLAASAMYTNTSPVTDLSGSITGCQFGDSDDWMDLIGPALTTKVQSAQDSTTMDIRNGMHGFLLPTQPRDFSFRTDVELDSNGAVVDSKYSIDDQGAFMSLCQSCVSPNGCQGIITLRYTVEYLSKNTWVELESSDVPVKAYDLALERLKDIPQFNANSLHLGNIWNSIVKGAKKVFSFATTQGPGLIDAASKIGALL